jgi:hypothetical protein
MLFYLLIGFFIDIRYNNIIEGSIKAFEPMKIYFNFACLHKFTLNGPEWVGGTKVCVKKEFESVREKQTKKKK